MMFFCIKKKDQNMLPDSALSISLLQNIRQFGITAPASRFESNSVISLSGM
jgi:hypothetical protein